MRITSASRVGATAALALCTVVGLGAPAYAIDVSGGCSGIAASTDGSGKVLQVFTAPDVPGKAKTGTKDNPILVDRDGTIKYQATAPPITDTKTVIKVYGITVHSESSANASRSTKKVGTEDMSDWFPIDQPGLYYVEGSYKGNGGGCSGSAWFKVTGSPVGSPAWIAGIFFVALGGVLLATSWPKRVGGAA